MNKSQVTIKDIARIAGVSFSTVSRGLNNSSQVSEKTRKRIHKIAEDLGFEFNAGARSMVTSRVGTVGVVLPEQFTVSYVNAYHGLLLNNLRTRLEQNDVDLLVTYQKNHYNGQNNIKSLIQRRKVDGFILLVEEVDQESLDVLLERDVPFVFTHYPPGKKVMDQAVIFTDHKAGGTLVAEHLLEQGRSRFIMMAITEGHLEFDERKKGFIDRLREAGHKAKILNCSNRTYEDAYRIMSENIELAHRSDAIFCANDLMALGTMRALKDAGFSLPGDISIVGYDNSDFSRYNTPALTSIHQPREELAEIACEQLFAQMAAIKEGKKYITKRISVNPALIRRESS